MTTNHRHPQTPELERLVRRWINTSLETANDDETEQLSRSELAERYVTRALPGGTDLWVWRSGGEEDHPFHIIRLDPRRGAYQFLAEFEGDHRVGFLDVEDAIGTAERMADIALHRTRESRGALFRALHPGGSYTAPTGWDWYEEGDELVCEWEAEA